MEEIEEKDDKIKVRFQDEDFVMEEVKSGSRFYNLAFMKKTNKRSGETVIEPGKPMYGIPFWNCVKRIVKHKTKKIFQDRNTKLFDYLKEYFKLRKELAELLIHEFPENRN